MQTGRRQRAATYGNPWLETATMIEFIEYPLGAIFVVSLVVILSASEIGRRFGARSAGRGGDNVSTLEAAILGLLALMISFTFSMARADRSWRGRASACTPYSGNSN